MNQLPVTPRTRLPQLDFLRAFACFLVIIGHSPIPPNANAFMVALNRGGWVGVDLFFVLSGFLVAGLLFEEYLRTGKVRPFRFAARRALKIYPAFYFYLVATTLAISAFATDLSNIRWPRIAAEAAFLQNYFPAIWGHTWSLAVEEHYYIAVILGIYLLVSRFPQKPFFYFPVFASVLCLGCLILRFLELTGSNATSIPHATHLRVDALSFGAMLAYFSHLHRAVFEKVVSSIRIPLLLGGAALILPPFLFDVAEGHWLVTYGLTTNYLGSGCIVAAAATYRRDYPRWFTAIARIGAYSYSIYLWHAIVVTWVAPPLTGSLLALTPHAGWIFCIGVSSLIGIAAARCIEFPVLAIRDTLIPSG